MMRGTEVQAAREAPRRQGFVLLKSRSSFKRDMQAVLICAGALIAATVIGAALIVFHGLAEDSYAASVEIDAIAASESFKARVYNSKNYAEFLTERIRRNEFDKSQFDRRTRIHLKTMRASVHLQWILPDFSILASVTAAGKESTLPIFAPNAMQSPAYELARSTGTYSVSEPFQVSSGDWQFDIYVPIVEDSQFSGMFAMRLDLEEALTYFVPEVVTNKNAVSALVNGAEVTGELQNRRLDPPFAKEISLQPVFSKMQLRVTPYRTAFITLSSLMLWAAMGLLLFLVLATIVLTLTLRVQKRLRIELENSELRFGTLAATARFGIWLINEQGSTLYRNAAMDAILGPEAEDAPRVLPQECLEVVEEVRAHPDETDYRSLECVINGRNVLMNILNMPGPEGVPRSVLLTCVDITRQKVMEREQLELERQVLHSQKLESMGILAAGIAHDFNNLLVGILGNSSMALEDIAPGLAARTAIEKVQSAAVRASDLTRQLLNYSGKGHFSKGLVSVSDCVDEIAPLLALSNQKKARITYELNREIPNVYADLTQMHQVIMNLMTNALEATRGPADEIRVTTGVVQATAEFLDKCVKQDNVPPGEYVYIDVTDTGCGMSPETVGRIFDPFFTTKFTGRGLGMSSVLGIVRGHGGAIYIHSAQGHGSTLRVLLPRVMGELAPAKVPASPAPEEPAAVESTLAAAGEVILVVDDEEAVRDFAKIALERNGYHVITAFDGEEGMKTFIAEQERIDAVLLDITMPGMNGEEVYLQIRGMHSNVPIIFSSGFDEGQGWQIIHDKPFTLFLRKPYRIGDLSKMVEKALAMRQVRLDRV